MDEEFFDELVVQELAEDRVVVWRNFLIHDEWYQIFLVLQH